MTPVFNKAGRYVEPSGKVGLWWNLPGTDTPPVYFAGPPPGSNRGQPVIHLGEAELSGRCSYWVRFTVPNVPSGIHTLTLIWHDRRGLFRLSEPIALTVTPSP